MSEFARNVADFDPGTPSIARVYDYFVGGKDNFASDRELAQRLIEAFPPLMPTVVENKQFLSRAVTWVARQGVAGDPGPGRAEYRPFRALLPDHGRAAALLRCRVRA
jgi:hypothetical protein